MKDLETTYGMSTKAQLEDEVPAGLIHGLPAEQISSHSNVVAFSWKVLPYGTKILLAPFAKQSRRKD